MIEQQRAILADTILNRLQHTSLGHCARVDYLERTEAIELCRYLSENGSEIDIAARVLLPSADAISGSEFAITTDQAIELRNRKLTRVCLFVPADTVDAAFSSLANSFELMDGRDLHSIVLKEELSKLPSEAQQIWRAVFQRLRRPLNVSMDRQLDLVGALADLSASGSLDQAGLAIWRVGLIADARPDFVNHLDKNRDCVIKLTRPGKIHATTSERIRALGASDKTVSELAEFFRKQRELHDVVAWSGEISKGHGPTLDRWVFPIEQRSNIESVIIRPFIGTDGVVERYCNLAQFDGPGGSLRARCGPKEKMVVRWTTEPPSPANVSRWRVEMVSSGGESIDDLDFDLPALEVIGNRRTRTIKLDLEFEEAPDFGLCIRVSAMGSAGNVLEHPETGDPVCAESNEFFLVKDTGSVEPTIRQTRKTEPTIAFGRLVAALDTRNDSLNETQAQWAGPNEEYFTLHLDERHILNIGTSRTLVEIQRRVLDDPRSGGSFEITLDELRAIVAADVQTCALSSVTTEIWVPFLRVREAFFTRLKKSRPRDVIESSDWTPELAAAASRYAQAYKELLADLAAKSAPRHVMMDALTIDSVLIRLVTNDSVTEDALLLLPTHPLRSAWLAGYTQLLRIWETQILQFNARDRKGMLDLDTVRDLTPINTPTFAFHTASSTAFVFFQNLRFFYGIALPPDVPDPHRRLRDIAQMLAVKDDLVGIDARHPERLAEYLKRFRATHPYTDTLAVTLINSDDGELFAEAVRRLLQPRGEREEFGEQIDAPTSFQVTSYVEDRRNASGDELASIRKIQLELAQTYQTDHLLPSLATTVRNASALSEQPLPDAHLAFVSDITRPQVVAVKEDHVSSDEIGSLTLHGLIVRLLPEFSVGAGDLRWRHKIGISGSGRPELHPAGPKFSETLVDLHVAMQNAFNYVLVGPVGGQPVLEVTVASEQQRLLEQLHEHSDWVITLDRFFALDYYDSPYEPHLSKTANKYLLDYAPEFAEGLGHKLMLTTGSRAEISVLLGRAMIELGFAAIDHSVRQLLHYLKTVSGRLAMQALGSSTNATAAVGLGVVTAWLQSRGRFEQAVLVPVDLHPHLFSNRGISHPGLGERRCDLVLFTLKRNIVEATFIEVKWRRGLTSVDTLAEDMVLQMEASANAIRERFFNDKRVDGALQRAALANVLRFYFERARRYQIFDEKSTTAYLENLGRLERTRAEFRPSYEGYIVSLDDAPRKPFAVGEAKIAVLTAQDFETGTEFHADLTRSIVAGTTTDSVDTSIANPAALSTKPPDGMTHTESAEPVNSSSETTQNSDAVKSTAAPDSEESQLEGKNGAPESSEFDSDAEIKVELGESNSGTLVEWLPSIKGSPHVFIIGIPGQGKSWTTMRILAELGAQKVPALVLDFHGQFSDPSSTFMQDAKPRVLDAAAGLPFSPFECSPSAGADDWKANAYAIAEIFAYVSGLGDVQRDIVFTSIRDVYRKRGFDTAQGARLSYPTMEEVLNAIEEGERARRVTNVSARLRPLLEMDVFRPTDDSPNLLELIRSGLVIDVHNLYIETAQLAVGAFVLRKLYKDMFRWGEASNLRLVVVLDEAHRLAKDITLPKLMKEGRKFGIAVVVASQGMSDFHQDVLGNAGTKIIFRVNYPESRRIAGFIRSRQGQDLAERIEQLPVGSAYVQTPEMTFGSVVRMYAPR